MVDLDLDQLRRLAEAATPGPYCRVGRTEILALDGTPDVRVIADTEFFNRPTDQHIADAEYFAAMHPQTTLALLNLIAALQAKAGSP